ncbi:MAG TPA: cupin domain-containing protein [Candidatus Omnitrophota bacterium]|nr:cupin domain-containing protein [Candidatus Omnitrophota bacterium]HPB67285.1 cupin domain-containing protein [Candidatus Omnitrophota bacterium]HQO57430.1 cupin domain-containing protein [Candidatus Omnitrophota bacterium]
MDSQKPLCVRCAGAEKFTRLLSGRPVTAGMKSGYVTLPAGEAVGEHVTSGREEAIVILEGRADIFCGGKNIFSADAVSLVYIPPETLHNIRNAGPGRLCYVYVVSPVVSSPA